VEVVIDDLAESPQLASIANLDALLRLERDARRDSDVIANLNSAAASSVELDGTLGGFNSQARADANLARSMQPDSSRDVGVWADMGAAAQEQLTPNRVECAHHGPLVSYREQ
jgi:hypothetical protein